MTAWIVQVALILISRLDLAIVGRATIILALGLTALPLVRRAQASVRHLLMAATFGTVLLLPLIINAVPTVTVHVPLAALVDTSGGVEHSVPSFATLLRFAWAAGAILLLVFLAIDLLRLSALRRGALPWPMRRVLIRSLVVTSGVRRSAEVLLHESVNAPLTYGLWRPTILLPIDAIDWEEADLRRALVHELEHVRRHDWATQLVARMVCACYWFHPLVWMAWRRLCLEAERACDDAVVQSAECTEYAEQLVNLARRISTARALPTLAMAHRSDLSARIVSLLDGTRRRGRAGFATTASVVGVVCLIVLVVASVRAIAPPIASPLATVAVQPTREVVIAPRLRDRGVDARHAVRHQRTRLSPKTSPKKSARPTIAERTPELQDSPANGMVTREVVDQPRVRNDGATMSNSSSASGTATHSASASSSSDSERQ